MSNALPTPTMLCIEAMRGLDAAGAKAAHTIRVKHGAEFSDRSITVRGRTPTVRELARLHFDLASAWSVVRGLMPASFLSI